MSRAPGRVLVSAFGSAGDLFPLVPMIMRLVSEGHDVRCAVSRPLGLYARTWGVPVYALGSGTEMRVFDDDRTITNRFGGWASWRHLIADYVAPSLPMDVKLLGRIFDQWRPDVVVTGSFSPAARLATHLAGLPRIEVTIYPQHPNRLGRARSFGWSLREAVAALAHISEGPRGDVVSDLAWGACPGAVVLHDQAILDDAGQTGEVVGFPYWDQGPQRAGDGQLVDRWLDTSPEPVVAVTLGSFLGERQRHAWIEAAKAIKALGVRAVFVGPWRRWDDLELDARTDLLMVGFVPLSHVAPRVDAVVHHGGVGTMFGVLHAGRPAVMVPQAFDQSFNARLVERAGAGVDADGRPLQDVLAEILDQPQYTTTAQKLAGELVPSTTATDRVVERILERL